MLETIISLSGPSYIPLTTIISLQYGKRDDMLFFLNKTMPRAQTNSVVFLDSNICQ